jgi:hypothetical protein
MCPTSRPACPATCAAHDYCGMDVALCVCFSQMVPFVVGKVSPVRLPLVSVLCVAGMVLALVLVKLANECGGGCPCWCRPIQQRRVLSPRGRVESRVISAQVGTNPTERCKRVVDGPGPFPALQCVILVPSQIPIVVVRLQCSVLGQLLEKGTSTAPGHQGTWTALAGSLRQKY